MNIKAALFARVSTREQAEEGYSLQAQERLIKEYAERSNFDVVKRFSVPESASGKQERKLFNELLEYLYAHTDIQIVVCEKVDRITRNLKDAVKIDDWLNEDETRQIHFVKQNLIIHKNAKSNDKFMWDIHLAVSRQYANNLSEETKKGLNEKAEQGWFPGNHKRGYKCIGEIGHKVWAIDEDNVDHIFIRKAFELFDTGNFTLRTLSSELYKEGWRSTVGKAISTSELHKLLKDPFYCGEFIWHNKLHAQGNHTPLVSKELFYSVQDRLTRKIKAGKYTKHKFLYGGSLLTCGGCNRAVTWDTKKGHNYGHCTKYNNTCSQKKYVRQEVIDKQILEILDSIKIDNPKLLQWVRKALKEAHKDETEYHETNLKELDTQLLKVERRLSVLYDDRVDGVITKEQYENKKMQYEEETGAILAAKEKHVKADVGYRQLGINIFEIAQIGGEIYTTKTTMDEKKQFLNFVFSDLILKDRKIVPTFQNGFEVVALRAKNQNWLRDMDSNHDR